MHLMVNICSSNLNCKAFSKKTSSCRILEVYLIARFANWVSFPGPYISLFSMGKRKRRWLAAGDWNTILLACKSWLSFLCYPGHGPQALSEVPGPGPRTALPDGCPLDSTNNQGENPSRLHLWSSSQL